jgi:hypothetical protein
MVSGATGLVVAGVIAALFLIGGAVLLFLGLRMCADAAAATRENERLSALLTAGPAQVMLVQADGRVDMPQRLADWFGLASPPRYLPELTGDNP